MKASALKDIILSQRMLSDHSWETVKHHTLPALHAHLFVLLVLHLLPCWQFLTLSSSDFKSAEGGLSHFGRAAGAAACYAIQGYESDHDS